MEADQNIIDTINRMSHLEMTKLWKSAPVGHEYFDTNKPYWVVFKERWDRFGGMKPHLSKQIEQRRPRHDRENTYEID